MSTKPAVVIDNGSGIVKAGFAGEETAKAVFSGFVGRVPKGKPVQGLKDTDVFLGHEAEDKRSVLSLTYPMCHGIVEDWNDMEHIWNYVYTQLKVTGKDHPVLLTEAPLNPQKHRETAAEFFFEKLGVPALFVSVQAVLSLYASGKTTGLVLDSGDGVTHAMPVFEGYTVPHAVQKSTVAGRDVTEHLVRLMRRGGCIFHSVNQREIVRQIKESECYVAVDREEEERKANARGSDIVPPKDYRLPDGEVLQLGSERFRAPEILFRPELKGSEYPGAQNLLLNAINASDLDLRKSLFGDVVLSGGSTMFTGFGDRLLAEVKKIAPKDVKIRISAPPDRHMSTWIGGSILASLGSFKNMWVSKEEYKEKGKSILHSKAF
jgi:centractin